MTNIRMKIAAAATILGLGGLGGFALASNPARDAQGLAAQQGAPLTASAGSTKPVVTRTSGAASPAAQTTAATAPVSYPSKPVTTRTSGGGGPNRKHQTERDDGPAVYED